jgi:cytochrome c
MDSFELNKFAGAALAALLVIFGSKTIVDIAKGGHDTHVKAGFTLPAPKDAPAAGGASVASAAAFSFDAVKTALAKASVENGQATFKKCTACHTPDKGGANRVGPNMWGVVGRKAGSVPGFAYSEPMKAQPEWTFEKLATFIHNPKSIAGTKMVFAGIADPAEMADLLAYMRTLSDSPVPLPN